MPDASNPVQNVPAAVTPASTPAHTTAMVPSSHEMMEKAEKLLPSEHQLLGLSIGGATGFALFRNNHPVLGLLGGIGVGVNAPGLLKKETRMESACNIAVHAAATGGSLLYKKHPVVGYIAGAMLGHAATAIVPGSRAHGLLEEAKAKLGK